MQVFSSRPLNRVRNELYLNLAINRGHLSPVREDRQQDKRNEYRKERQLTENQNMNDSKMKVESKQKAYEI